MMDESNEPENALKVNEHSKIKRNYGFLCGIVWDCVENIEKKNKLGLVLFKNINKIQQKSDSTNNLVNYLAGRLM